MKPGGTHRERGPEAELQAQRYLEQQGLATLDKNYRGRRGEIDLVMREGDTPVFVEVRYRKNPSFGSAAESVDMRKQQKIIATANQYLHHNYRTDPPACRFDVLAISGKAQENIDWIRDAFQLTA